MPLFEYNEETKRTIGVFNEAKALSRLDKLLLLVVKVVGLRTTGKWPDRVYIAVLVLSTIALVFTLGKDLSYLDRKDSRASAVLQVNVLCDKEVPATCSLLKDMCEQDKSLCEELGLP